MASGIHRIEGLPYACKPLQGKPRNEIGRNVFIKAPEPLRRDQTYRYQHETADLLRSMASISERSERRLPPPTVNFKGIVGKEPYPVTRKAGEILRRLI